MVEEKKQENKEEKQQQRQIPDIKSGMLVRVHQKIKELDPKGNPKERVQVFEGIVIARQGGNTPGATFTVRKIATGGVGVEKIYPLYLHSILKIEVVKKHKVRRSKLYYLRRYKKKLKEIKLD